MPRSLLRWREPDHEAQHAVRTDYLAPARFGEVATGFDLRLFGGLQGCAVLGFDALILAALPLAVRTVRDVAQWNAEGLNSGPATINQRRRSVAGAGFASIESRVFEAKLTNDDAW